MRTLVSSINAWMQNLVVFNGNASLELDTFNYAITVYRLWKKCEPTRHLYRYQYIIKNVRFWHDTRII